MPPERLSKFDAIFYYTDNRRAAMQVSVGFLVEGPIDFNRYLTWLAPRIDHMPTLRMMLKPFPLGLRLPAWMTPDVFDVSAHVTSHRLDPPGDEDQLKTQFTELVHQRLSFSRPLWHLHVINGVEGDRAALLLSAHHCIADAEGVMEMFRIFFETTPIGSEPASRVSSAGLAREAHADRPLHGLRAMFSPKGHRRMAIMGRYMRTRGPRFPFTRPVSGRVNIAWRHIPLQDLRMIAKAFGGTVTDVILAAMGGAMDSYAAKHNVPVEGTYLRLQVPANVRLPNKYGELGNELAMLPGVVPLGIKDPAERLQHVAKYNRALKDLDIAPMIHGMMGAAFGMATPPGQALLCRTMVSKPYLHLARVFGLPPQEHALVSSVVMPPVTYSIDGQQITAILNFVACQFNMGFVSSPLTYGDTVTLTLSTDAEHLGDTETIMDDAVSGVEELLSLAADRAATTPGP
jgi:WS/DGAT/MGAT family acyltransferase